MPPPAGGSPPHSRGKVNMKRLIRAHQGITPALAGKSRRLKLCPVAKWDHPRTRGEKPRKRPLHSGRRGSPPHSRGKVYDLVYGCDEAGITPALAGKSLLDSIKNYGLWDHPRTRGEKLFSMNRGYSVKGSPPHSRGKVEYTSSKPVETGITPALAGKRRLHSWQSLSGRDHPRTRGEKPLQR